MTATVSQRVGWVRQGFRALFRVLACMCIIGLAAHAQVITPPKQLKQSAIVGLQGISTTDKDLQKKIGAVVDDINQSLSDKNTNFFLDDWRILPPPQGQKVFDREKNAADDLSDLLKDKNTPASLRTTLQRVLDALVQADKEIAERSLITAERFVKAGEGDAKVVTRARQQFDQASKETDPKKAIEGFENAWQSSQEVANQNGLVITSFSNSPGVFSSRITPNKLTATFQRVKNGNEDGKGDNNSNDPNEASKPDPQQTIEFIEIIQDAATGATVRRITTSQNVPAFPQGDDDSSKLPPWSVTLTSSWDGKDNSGQIAKDGTYNYIAFGRIVSPGDGKKNDDTKDGNNSDDNKDENFVAMAFPVSDSVTLDSTPPTLTFGAASPAPNAAGWNKTPVSFAFTTADNLSGVASTSVPTPLILSAEGAAVTGAVTVTDVAGNSATFTSPSVKIDKTPPTLTITSPADGSTVSTAALTATGIASDSLSGLASIKCNGVQVGSLQPPFSCNLTLNVGANVITFEASDVADNVTKSNITVTLLPPPVITSVTPNSGKQGQQQLSVAVTGQFTHFVQGTTTANFGAGITVTSVAVSSATTATVLLNIDSAAATGSRNVTLRTNTEVVTLTDGFTVQTGASLLTVNPNTGYQGQQNLAVALTGQFTSWNQTTTTASFGAGITVSLTVTSSNTATALLSIDPAAASGARDVVVQTGSQQVSLANGFTVKSVPAPSITDFTPKTGPIGTVISVTGSNFVPTTGVAPQVSLNKQGGGTLAAPVSSSTNNSLQFVVPTGASTGPVTVTTIALSATSATSLTIVASSDFTLSASPSSTNLIQGQAVSYAVTLKSTNNFNQLVTLTASGLPAGPVTSFKPQQITAGQTSVFSIAAPSTQPLGQSTLTFSASSTVDGIALSQTATTQLNVVAPTTSFIGRTVVDDPAQTTLAGVTVTMMGKDGNGGTTGCNGKTVSDAAGNFSLQNLSSACVGPQLIGFDGTTAAFPPGKYAGVNLIFTLASGKVTASPVLVHLPRIDNLETFYVQQNNATDQTYAFRTVPGLSVTVYKGTTFTMPDGSQPNPFPLVGAQVPVDRLPDAKPPVPTMLSAFIVAFQPANVNTNQPVAVYYPNTVSTPPGVNMTLMTLDPTRGAMVPYGTGTVSGDGTQIIPDFDPSFAGHRYGIVHFDWHGPMPPPPPDVNPGGDGNGPEAGEPVDVASGVEVITSADIAFNTSLLPVTLVRTYRTLSGAPGPFGIGTSHNYGHQLDTSAFVRGQGVISLVMPDGNHFPFSQRADGTFTNSTIPSLRAAILTNPSPGSYNLRWKDGANWLFQTSSQGPLIAFLSSLGDRNGNLITLVRDPNNPVQITQIKNPVGRRLNLVYDSFNRITSISDPIGRTTKYTYNSQGTLAAFTNVAGGVTTYTYDPQNRLTQVSDPRGITFLQNTFDSNGRVAQQTSADGAVVKFQYELLNPTTPTSPVLSTTVTDALGNQTKYRFNTTGFIVDVTNTLGQRTSFTRDSGTNLVLSVIDTLARKTSYTYDLNGNVTSVTRLAGTPDAITVSTAYEPTYNQVSSVADPLGHTTLFSYDTSGNLLSVTDPLNHKIKFGYDNAGQLSSTTDATGSTMQFTYVDGDFIKVTDPLGRSTTRVVDGIGRLTGLSKPLGQTIQYQYDALNRITQVTDPIGGQITYTYDGNSNLLSVKDALQHSMTFTYDSMDRLATRTDALGNVESYTYDLNGNLIHSVNRRGRASDFKYDALNRRVFVGFGTQAPSSYESTINYSYDAGSRMIGIQDSTAGTIAGTFDGLDRLTSEITSQGVIRYTYDAASRRTSMSVAGQAPVNYTYDDANRLTRIDQVSLVVGFGYDVANRRTSLKLPNGISMNYTYDAASQLRQITYSLGSNPLGDLTYDYDSGGRRINMGGALARTNLPAAVSTASYNSENQVLQFGSAAMTYDATGNLINDGTNTYSWDARNQLVSIQSQNLTASFKYDAFGRRSSKTVNGVLTSFLYDGVNPVQESSPGRGQANLLTGLGADEIFTRTDSAGDRSFLTDVLGSTVASTDSSGAVQAQYTYEPFGATTVSDPADTNSYRFTGREDDGTGLYYYRARYYSPALARFISEDPLGIRGGDLNLYRYAGGSPVGVVDPSGLCNIVVRFSPVAFGLAYHAYILTTDDNGTQFFRGGPAPGYPGPSSGSSGASSSSPGGASSQSSRSCSSNSGSSNSGNSSSPGSGPGGPGQNTGPWGPLTTTAGPYTPDSVDYDPGNPPSVPVLSNDAPCGPYNSQLNQALNQIQNANIPYNPLSTNSNATVSNALQQAGLPVPTPPVRVPGWGHSLP
jgi:RHS repeat-associated protein